MRRHDDANILNAPHEKSVCERMVDACVRLEKELGDVILAKTLDREAYLLKMGELTAVREVQRRLVTIYRGEYG
jgi:hypothetical protein